MAERHDQKGTGRHGHKDTQEPGPHTKEYGRAHNGEHGRQHEPAHAGGAHSGKQPETDSADLKRRESRDEKGEIHHHTKT